MFKYNASSRTGCRARLVVLYLGGCAQAVCSTQPCTLPPLGHFCLSDFSQSSKMLRHVYPCWTSLPWPPAVLNKLVPLFLYFRLYLMVCCVIISTVFVVILSHLSLLRSGKLLWVKTVPQCLAHVMWSIDNWLNF